MLIDQSQVAIAIPTDVEIKWKIKIRRERCDDGELVTRPDASYWLGLAAVTCRWCKGEGVGSQWSGSRSLPPELLGRHYFVSS